MIPIDHTFESLSVGDKASVSHTITQEGINSFANVSGDYNPLHVIEGVAHGMYLGSFVSELIGMQLPGRRSLLVREEMEFKHSVRAGEQIEVLGTIVHISAATHIIELAIVITRAGKVVSTGNAHVRVQQ
jgi:acyl dehydratase